MNPNNKKPAFLSGSTLKLIAIITMLIDHIGAIFFPQYMILRYIGRLAFPIFCFLLVEGFFHTKNIKKYLLRLGLFAILSELPFDLAFYHTVWHPAHQNVFFTLFLGLLAIHFFHQYEQGKAAAMWGFIGVMVLGVFLNSDYGVGGIVLIFLFYQFRQSFLSLTLTTTALLFLCFGTVELPGALSLIPIFCYNGKRGIQMKYLFYLFYPLHLLILWGISLYIGGM